MTHGSAPQWRKSSHSGHQGGECVEVAEISGRIAVRDSKNPARRVHLFDKAAFRAFTRSLRVEDDRR
ncbi:DUF397 domain-containing protein [Actinocorallia populi]|uniref:DUF397 domain-containing protein n=1 Tax=Actinocorallia populi TaxID=2079200 RepID=UPI000D097438|nr:DUF397 domain-containing protein [Actinocorallia populi]